MATMKRGYKDVSYTQLPTNSKVGPKESADRKNKVCTISTYTLPVIRYPLVIVTWPREEHLCRWAGSPKVKMGDTSKGSEKQQS